ncbi:hypothetical protein, partial [Salinicola socius]|uniref:hypothetical protein n=1 Tax=Salinicola socius TaxID=404433 RepID=UPI001ABF9864
STWRSNQLSYGPTIHRLDELAVTTDANFTRADAECNPQSVKKSTPTPCHAGTILSPTTAGTLWNAKPCQAARFPRIAEAIILNWYTGASNRQITPSNR